MQPHNIVLKSKAHAHTSSSFQIDRPGCIHGTPSTSMAQRSGAQETPGNVAAATPQLLTKLEEDLPTIVPEELVMHQFKQAGCNCDEDPQLVKLVALAGQRFLSAVANDAIQIAKRRGVAPVGKKKAAEPRLVLNVEDTAAALREYGVSVRPAPYYVDASDR
ncbi:MAG: hypothetical protein J3K34DRAFT_443021 [Monoraphidium minutum]|nr:MAG: hypothetical protein J3K34DRAFT_443021 [Monoraphidium minutum]